MKQIEYFARFEVIAKKKEEKDEARGTPNPAMIFFLLRVEKDFCCLNK